MNRVLKVRSYIATSPVLVTVQKALYTHSGKHSATLQLLREDHLFTYPLLAVPRYSLIQLSEVFQRGVNEIAKSFERGFESGFSPLRSNGRTVTSPCPASLC